MRESMHVFESEYRTYDLLSKIFEPFGHLQLFRKRGNIGHGGEIRL